MGSCSVASWLKWQRRLICHFLYRLVRVGDGLEGAIDFGSVYARSHHEATRRTVDAWSCLEDDYIVLTMIPTAQARKSASVPARQPIIHTCQDHVTTTRLYGDCCWWQD